MAQFRGEYGLASENIVFLLMINGNDTPSIQSRFHQLWNNKTADNLPLIVDIDKKIVTDKNVTLKGCILPSSCGSTGKTSNSCSMADCYSVAFTCRWQEAVSNPHNQSPRNC